MRKQNKIKWREPDVKELRKAVQKFNAKRTGIIKKSPGMEDFLPEKLNVKAIKASIETRNDFKKKLHSIERFMKPGSEKPIETSQGVRTTKYEIGELKRATAIVNQKRSYQRKKADVSTDKGTMGTIEKNNLNPKQFNPDKMGIQDFKLFAQSVNNQMRKNYYSDKDNLYKDNYLKACLQNLGVYAGDILSIVENIPASNLAELYFSDPVLQIDFVYDPFEALSKANLIVEHLNEAGYF